MIRNGKERKEMQGDVQNKGAKRNMQKRGDDMVNLATS